MLSMLKYMAIMAVFYILSDKVIKADLAGPMQTFSDMALYALVFIMGMRIGANEEVISKLGSVGLQALATTFLAFFGSVFMAFLVRSFMMLDRQGLGKKHIRTESETGTEVSGANGLKSTAIIFSLVALGMLAGHFIVPEMIVEPEEFQEDAGTMIDICLCILLAGVGYGLGIEGNILGKIRSIGFRVLGLPVAIMSGTAIMGLAYGVYGPLTIRESLAIFMGMGWYGLAPAIILNAGHATASAISFLHNIFREVLSMLIIPIVAQKIGYFEAASLPGSTGMDCCLPSVKKYTNGEVAIMSLISGIVCSMAVTVLVPVIID